MACSPKCGSSTKDVTFISEAACFRSLSPVRTSGDDSGGSMAITGGSMWMFSMLSTSITTGVSFSLTNSKFKEGVTSFINVVSDLRIASTSMLSTLTPRGDTGEDVGAGEHALEGESGDDGACVTTGMDGYGGEGEDGGTGGNGLDCLLIFPF